MKRYRYSGRIVLYKGECLILPTQIYIPPSHSPFQLTQTYNTQQVRTWLLDHMHANPFTSKRCLMHGKTVYQKPGRPLRRSSDISLEYVL